MKTAYYLSLAVKLTVLTCAGTASLFGQTNLSPQTNAPPVAEAAPPPSSPPAKSQADLEKLVAPIALYPDPLIATVLPASAYPLEIVQAARFVKDTNNLAKLDAQEWDANVKAVAKFPDVIAQMDANISWTSDLGDAFINQPKEVMDAIQAMRAKAQSSGALKTTPEQVVGMTNQVVTNVVETQTVVVTNQVIQIQPAQPEVIYVPQYNPTVVYSGYPVAYPGYYYPPPPAYYAGASLLSFGVGMATGAIIANNCDWGHGGCWSGGDVDVDINQNINRNVNRDVNRTGNVNQNRTANANRQKWQPDQNRLKNSGSQLSSTQSRAARGYPTASSRSASGAGAQRTASSAASTRANAAGRVSSPSAGASRPDVSRPSSSPNVSRQVPSASRSEVNRPSSSATRPSPSSVSSRPSSSQRSAFSGSGGGGATRQASARGGGSRGGGGGRGGGRR